MPTTSISDKMPAAFNICIGVDADSIICRLGKPIRTRGTCGCRKMFLHIMDVTAGKQQTRSASTDPARVGKPG